MPVTYGVHLARAYMRQAKAGGRSCAIVFLDLKEAFYRIFRPICMKDSVTDEDLAKLMHKLNMPEDAVDMLRVILAGPSALEQAELSEMESRCLKAVHRETTGGCSADEVWLAARRSICRCCLQLCLGCGAQKTTAFHA